MSIHDVTRQPLTPIKKRKRSLPEATEAPVLDWSSIRQEILDEVAIPAQEWAVKAQQTIGELPRKAGEGLRRFLESRPESEKPNRRELLENPSELDPDQLEAEIQAAKTDRFAKHRVEAYLTNEINKRSVARSIMWVEDIYSCDSPRYGGDVAPKSYFLREDGSIDVVWEAEEIMLPKVSLPMIVDLDARGTNLHLYEDKIAVDLIEAAACRDHTIVTKSMNFIDGPQAVAEAFTKLKEHRLPPVNILCDPQMIPAMMLWPGIHIEDGIRGGKVGMYQGCTIYTSPFVSKNRLYVLPAPRYLGVLAFSSNLHLAFSGFSKAVVEEILSASVLHDNTFAVVVQESNLKADIWRRNTGCGLLGRDMRPEAMMWQVIPPSLPGTIQPAKPEPGSGTGERSGEGTEVT